MIAPNGKVSADQRFTASNPCPICKGHEGMGRGRGERCTGYLSGSGKFAFCSRVEADETVESATGTLYKHRLGHADRHDRPRTSANGKPKGKGPGHETPRDAALSYAQWLLSEKGVNLGEPTCEWVYESPDGKPHMAVCRFESADGRKTYRPFHRGADRRWRSKDPEGPLPLYRLPTLAEADLVVVCEGEKAADAVRGLDLIATTPAHGAKNPHKADWSPLAGKDVVILPDNDEPGRAFAEKVVELLGKLAPRPTVRIVELPGLPPKGDAVEWIEAGGTRADLLRLIGEADPVDLPGPDGAGDDRPEIEVTVERHEVVERAVEALAADPDLYCRGGALVTVVVEHDEVARLAGGVRMANARGTPRVLAVPESGVGCRLTRHARFHAWTKDKSGEDRARDCHPPGWLIRAVAEQGHWPGVRPLVAIAAAPFIRADGTVVQTPGYDPETATLYRPSIDFPAVPDRVSREEARDAAARLLAVVDQFPFASGDDAAVWLSGLLTALARPAIPGPVPGIAVVGNRAGCGKGLLIDVVGIAAWGMNVPTFCYPGDGAEANKVKVAIALEGIPAVHFDNLDEGSTYGNPALDSALTATVVQDRILGTSRTTGRLALRPCWWLSGNNTAPAKDAYRRWLPCNIATSLERPEERDDIKVPDLRAHVAERRGEIVRDALAILKAHAAAGHPGTGKPPLGSFEQWDRIVRGAVWFATGRDCCATRRRAADESPERQDKLALLEGWRELRGGDATGVGVTAEDALKQVAEAPASFETLRAFFARKSRDGKPPTARQIGNLIRGMQGSKFGGLHFEKAGERKRSILWRVSGSPESCPDSPRGGESGESSESNRQPLENGAERVNICSRYPLDSSGSGDQTRQTHQTHHDGPVDPDDAHWR